MKRKTGKPMQDGKSRARRTLLESIIESSDDAIVSYTLDGIYTSWNPAAERLFGYSAEEMIGQPLLILVPPENVDAVANVLGEIRNDKPISNYETVRLRKDGSAVPVSMTVSAIYDLTGAVIGGSSICRDLTEQRQAFQNASKMVSIVESSNDAIISASTDGIVSGWNAAAERMYGYSAEEMIGQSVNILYHLDSPWQRTKIIDSILAGLSVSNIEVLRVRKDGSTFPVSMTVSPIFDATGEMLFTTSISRDMTEQKQAFQNASRMASIVESSNDGIVSVSMDGIIYSWNPAAEKMYGYSAEEMIGQSFSIVVPSENADRTVYIMGRIRDGHRVEHFETVRIRKDGSAFPVSLTISPIHDLTGAITGVSSVSRDLTERNRAEQKFRAILESSPDAMVIVDKTGTITIVNSQTEKVFGYRRDELLGQPVELLIPSRLHANLRTGLDHYFASPYVQPIWVGLESYGLRKDEHEFPAEVNLGPIETADGVLVAATIRDVTDHKQLIRRLEEMNELRNEFVATVTHDIRSPMTSISGYADLLIDVWDTTSDDEKKEYLKVIARNTEHLAQFVEDALQVARIETGEFTYDIDAFDIRSLVQGALGEADCASVDRRFELIAPGDIPLVWGDADRQWQVLTNLFSNAVKFSPAEEPITVGLSRNGDYVQVAITDRGIGIAKDDLSKLFQKFGRVSRSGGGKVLGNGLGLYICKTLVEAQGGRIWCESSPARGSTFFFTIPVAP